MSHKRFPVELDPEERTYVKRLISSGSPETLPRRQVRIRQLCGQGPEGSGLDRRTHGGGRGRVPGAPGPVAHFRLGLWPDFGLHRFGQGVNPT